jgi:hypothetical protein
LPYQVAQPQGLDAQDNQDQNTHNLDMVGKKKVAKKFGSLKKLPYFCFINSQLN